MKRLELIIGDDELANPITMSIFESDYVSKLKEELYGYEINFTYATQPIEVIALASKFDVVITDLDYTGHGKGKEGYDVVDAVSKLNPKPVLILCTSSDNYAEIKGRTEGKIDYHAGRGKGHKFNDLIAVLIDHYKNTK